MTLYMISENEHDYIQIYESAVATINKTPDHLDTQHKAVLALARAGSLSFALAEYKRHGLDTIRRHEDIMALGGRLSKDLYLTSSGDIALEHARNSAHKYEAAFNDTKGYYSGVNAATMALMADMPIEIVADRAKTILDSLPDSQTLTPQNHYFIEATRAECHLLLGNTTLAQESLIAAISYDPLNYTAHASTLKQFHMILTKRNAVADWLLPFKPPKPMHYAGTITLNLTDDELKALKGSVIDHIQKNDIGFGFGSLAAGSDIIIAEALLSQGGKLHVMLPCSEDSFLEHSVRPIGENWVKRFKACIENASSVNIATRQAPWPDYQINQLTGQYAMGQAVLHSHYFSVEACQLLIWDKDKKSSYTAVHAEDWKKTEKTQIIISPITSEPSTQAKDKARDRAQEKAIYTFVLKRSDKAETQHFETIEHALKAVKAYQEDDPQIYMGLDVSISGSDSDTILNKILEKGTPNSILMSEIFASILGLYNAENLKTNFAGLIKLDKDTHLRCYSLNI